MLKPIGIVNIVKGIFVYLKLFPQHRKFFQETPVVIPLPVLNLNLLKQAVFLL